MSDELVVAGHAHWLPLLLEGDDVDGLVSMQVQDLIGDVAAPERVEDVTALVAGMTRRVRDTADAAAAEGVMTIAAWMHLQQAGIIEAGPIALLRAHLVVAAGLEQVVESLVGDPAERFGPVDVLDHDTACGPAAAVRVRPVVESEAGRDVHEQRMVVWHRPRQEAAVVLSAYVTDLVEGARLAPHLLELASGVDLGTP